MPSLRERIAKEIALGRSGGRPDRITADRVLDIIGVPVGKRG